MREGAALRWGLLAAAVTMTGALVVGAFSPAPHSGGDNSTYVSLAYSLVSTGSYTEVFDPAGLPHSKYPPVFPLVLAGLIALGARTWIAMKSVAVVSTIAAAAFTYLWAERRLGAWPALAVTMLYAACAAVVYYSHWTLSDPLFVAFTMAAFWAYEGGGAGAPEGASRAPWIAAAVMLAGLAYFTRSAGLPMVVALFACLALDGRWKAVGLAAVGIGVPAALWWLRGRDAPASYAAEFWLVDPYQPTLGTIGVLDLVPRAIANFQAYVTRHGPGGVIGQGTRGAGVLGVAMVATTLWGWFSTVRERVGLPELFLPLYFGLILLWPLVWSGDRFALPLYPLVFFYGAVVMRDLARRVPAVVAAPVVALVLLAIALPEGGSWSGARRESRACTRIVEVEGPFGCYGPGVAAFVEAAGWAGGALPDGAGVMTRKPSHFFVLSGVPSRTFPFDPSPDAQLAAADALGVRYILIDEWDVLARQYVGGAVLRRPGAFCFVRAFGQPGAGGAQLIGILPAEQRSDRRPAENEQARIAICPESYGSGEPAYSSSSSSAIPLLEALDP
ncbi:MAG: ArnT family glycosyltransferase [Gemmatimonadales bacterium]